MIHFSVSWMRDMNSDDLDARKVYAHAQYTNIMDLWEFARHISEHDSKYNRSDIIGVITTMVDCLYELLLDGKRVQLGDLGVFYPSIRSKGADSMEEFSSSSNIIGLRVNWCRGSEFQKIFQDAEFEFVPTREEFEKAKANTKAALPKNSSSSSSEDGSDSGSSSGDSGSADQGSSSSGNQDENSGG